MSYIHNSVYCYTLDFNTFLLLVVYISPHNETNPVKMPLQYFNSAVSVNSKLDYHWPCYSAIH